MKFTGFVGAALFAATVPCIAQASLIENGSFELTASPVAAGSWALQATLPGWSVGSKKVEIRNNVVGSAFDGDNFVELDTTANSWIGQMVETDVDAHYLLSFAYSPRMRQSAATNGIEVLWNGVSLTTLTGTNATNDNDWTVYNFDVVGSGVDTVLFKAVGLSDGLGVGREARIDHRHLRRMDCELAGEAVAQGVAALRFQAVRVAEIDEHGVERLHAGRRGTKQREIARKCEHAGQRAVGIARGRRADIGGQVLRPPAQRLQPGRTAVIACHGKRTPRRLGGDRHDRGGPVREPVGGFGGAQHGRKLLDVAATLGFRQHNAMRCASHDGG